MQQKYQLVNSTENEKNLYFTCIADFCHRTFQIKYFEKTKQFCSTENVNSSKLVVSYLLDLENKSFEK